MSKPTGIELIAKEREEQINKHGYNTESDKQYDKEELLDFAISLITLNVNDYPFNPTLFVHLKRKTRKDQLAIAGALIAAELDRLTAIEATHTQDGGQEG